MCIQRQLTTTAIPPPPGHIQALSLVMSTTTPPLSPLHSWRHAHIEHIRGQLVDTDISRREHHSSAQQGIKNIKWIYPIGSPINLLFDSISGKSLEYFPLDATLEYVLQETFLCIAFD